MTILKTNLGISSSALALVALSLLTPSPVKAQVDSDPSKSVEFANDIGRVEPTAERNLTVILQLHNSDDYDRAVEALYDPDSPTYRHWFTEQDFARYAPSPAEFDIVKNELLNHGFTIVSEDPDRFSVRVHGTVANAESAFQTEIHTLSLNGRTFEAPIREARLSGEAGALVASVAGLERHRVNPTISVMKNRAGQPRYRKQINADQVDTGLLGLITDRALSEPEMLNFSTYGLLPMATYFGSIYDKDPNLAVTFTPKQLWAHYGLESLIKQGYDGTGETIAVIDPFGYSAAEKDANYAAELFGLPPLSSSNFRVIYPEGKPGDPNAADFFGWTAEIALDIQASHSIAPGAKILLVASAGADDEDMLASLEFIIAHKLSNAVSDSWGGDLEIASGVDQENAYTAVLKKGAAVGISFQFSTGDGGDWGLGTPVGAVLVPSNSPYATAVGGTSILNNPATAKQIVAGWGNNITFIGYPYEPSDPPVQSGFFGGAGGGESTFFAKPSWQKALAGNGRHVPDVSALADPYTGFAIIYTQNGVQYFQPGTGGTSLACPIFTAIWTIADQYNGKPLGFAAPTIARLKTGQITDVVPNTALVASDPTGTIYDANGATFYSADGLFAGDLYSQKDFPSALWITNQAEIIAISFGTDTSLTVTPGWDNVTGYGEPNGLPFIEGVTGRKRSPLEQ